jgi:hypothetical protein
MVQKERKFFQIKEIKFSFFFMGTVAGLLSLPLMYVLANWLFSYFDCHIIIIVVTILLFFPILLLGYIGKKRNNQLWVNISNFLAGFYIFDFFPVIVLLPVFCFSILAGCWNSLF